MIIFVVLYFQDDDEAHLSAFYCVQDLMSKGSPIFLIHFIRLGVLQRITELAGESDDLNDEIIDGKINQKVYGSFMKNIIIFI